LSVSLFLFLLSWLASPAASAALVRYDLDSLVKKSDLIVRGRVVAQESYRGTFPGFGEVILTEVTIEVAGVWKGILEPETDGKRRVRVQLLGGQIGDEWQLVPESPRYALHEEVLVFARRWREELWTTGWLQGKYRVVEADDGSATIEGARGAPLPNGTRLDRLETEVERRVSAPSTPSPSTPAPSGPGPSSTPADDPDASSGGAR